jgi:hypothetical protein
MTGPKTYLDRPLSELDDTHTGYADILAASAIVNIDPDRHAGEDAVFIGFPVWGLGRKRSRLPGVADDPAEARP